ncbi:DUF1700 domain-containing protein [Glycomyces terrestris]|uniref:Uncharacterized protein n=1 Tax=Glycomyces terrestris TaxID=2493553 RepID=A0A426V5L0_9ACTN|nr:hypothetical protein [Glycomyces terrestris]RRS02121.1 hypothetical protein EIW28_05170 [Glycomyces terrestris]
MTDHPRESEAAAYLAEVRRHLADLPTGVRDELLADLEAHLNEVAADLEPGATLAGRLGSPEAYAAELRDTVYVEGSPGEPTRPARLQALGAAVTRGLDRITGSAGAGTFAELRQSLKPAWWIVRGIAAAGLIAWIVLRLEQNFAWAALERPLLTIAAILALALPLAWYSVRLGNRSEGWRQSGRTAVALAGIALVGFTAVRAADVIFGEQFSFYDGSGYSPYAAVNDVYPYTADGELLTGVYLLDQNGNPLYLGDPSQCSVLTDDMYDLPDNADDPYGDAPTDWDYGYRYPICAPPAEGPTPGESETEEAPTSAEEPTESASESESPSESPSEESASPTESPSPSPTG